MNQGEQEISFKRLFLPLTNLKALSLIFIVGFIVYFNMLFNGFVWDDVTYILSNSELKNFNLLTLIGPNMFNSSGYFRPIPAIYFSILYNLFGNSAFFYHFSQLLLHILATTLLYFIFKKFFNKPLSLILSLIFLVHPINVESVAYIGASQSQLYFLFGGLAFYLALEKLSTKKILLMHLFLLLAILVKEISILYFLVVYFYLWLKNKSIPKLIFLTSFVTLFAYATIRFSSLGTILQKMQRIPISEMPLFERILHIPIIFFYYLKTFFFPKLLVINQVWTIRNIDLGTFYFPLAMDLLFLGCIFGFLYYLFKKKSEQIKLYIFFLIWFLAGMAFLLQIFPLDMTVADRWFYFPLVGFLGIFAIVLDNLWPYIKKYEKLCLTLVIILLTILSMRTVIRNNDWQSPITLYSKDAKVYDNYDIENYLGAELVYAGRYEEALPHLLKSVRLLPHDTNLFNVGSVYDHLRNVQKARAYYQKTLDSKNDYSTNGEVRKLAYEGLLRILLLSEKPEKINGLIVKSTEEFPKDGALWAYLAIDEYKLNHYEKALLASEKAKQLLPNPTTNKLYKTILNKSPLNLR